MIWTQYDHLRNLIEKKFEAIFILVLWFLIAIPTRGKSFSTLLSVVALFVRVTIGKWRKEEREKLPFCVILFLSIKFWGRPCCIRRVKQVLHIRKSISTVFESLIFYVFVSHTDHIKTHTGWSKSKEKWYLLPFLYIRWSVRSDIFTTDTRWKKSNIG